MSQTSKSLTITPEAFRGQVELLPPLRSVEDLDFPTFPSRSHSPSFQMFLAG